MCTVVYTYNIVWLCTYCGVEVSVLQCLSWDLNLVTHEVKFMRRILFILSHCWVSSDPLPDGWLRSNATAKSPTLQLARGAGPADMSTMSLIYLTISKITSNEVNEIRNKTPGNPTLLHDLLHSVTRGVLQIPEVNIRSRFQNIYPPVIKHGNGKWTIYQWFSSQEFFGNPGSKWRCASHYYLL